MKSGGQSHQQLSEKHLSHIIVNLLELFSSDTKEMQSILKNLQPWSSESANHCKFISDEKTSKSKSEQDLVKNITIGILTSVYIHEINKDQMTSQLNEQIVNWMNRSKRCDLMSGYRMLFQSLLLSL